MSWENVIYYCLGDRDLGSESLPDLGKHALWRRRRQIPVCGQVSRHVDIGQMGLSPSNKLSGSRF